MTKIQLCNLSAIAAVATLLLMIAITSTSAAQSVTGWKGDGTFGGAGWVNPTTSTIVVESTDVHEDKTAIEFSFNDKAPWIGAGWDWTAFKVGPYGTDTTGCKNLQFWIKSTGTTPSMLINLKCAGVVLDTPPHHSAMVALLKYCPTLSDGKWHLVVIPIADLAEPVGFDSTCVNEFQMGFPTSGTATGNIFLDDISFTK